MIKMRTSLGPSTRRAEGHGRSGHGATGAGVPDTKQKKTAITSGAWEEARALVWQHRHRLALGMGIMVINRLAGLVLPWTSGRPAGQYTIALGLLAIGILLWVVERVYSAAAKRRGVDVE